MAASRVGVVTEEEKQVLLERYLDIVWIDDVTQVKCVRCHRVPIHHYVSNCRHIFCRNCRTMFSDGGQWKCPLCKECVKELSDQEWQLEDTIFLLTAHCPNKKYGCHYQGQLSTIPGHLRSCEDTREAALPAEIREMTLDTVADQVKRLINTVGEMRREMRELKDNYEIKLKQLTEREDEFCRGRNEEKRQSDEKEWNKMMENDEEVKKDLELIKAELRDHREHLDIAKQLIKDVKQLQDRESRDALEMEQLRTRLQQQETLIGTQAEQITRLNVTLEYMQSASTAFKENWDTKWKDMNKHMDEVNKDIHEQTQQMVEFKGKQLRDALEMQQLKSQLQQQHTLNNSNKTQLGQMMKQMNVAEVQVKSVTDDVDKAKETLLLVTQYIDIEDRSIAIQAAKKGLILMPKEALKDMIHVYDWDIKYFFGGFDELIYSDVFSLKGYHYGAKTSYNIEFGFILTYFQLIDYDNTKLPINTKSLPKFTFVIKDLSNSPHNRDRIITTVVQFEKPLEYGSLIYMTEILIAPPYFMSNGMKLSVYIEPPSIARSFFSNNGILLWRLDNYKERLKMEVDGLIVWHESPYFYTSPQGYRVLTRLRLSEKTVRGGVWFLNGEFDSFITKKFPHRLTVTLLNHTDQSKNLMIIQEGKMAGITFVHFKAVSASSLESDGYVKDDTLLIKSAIESL